MPRRRKRDQDGLFIRPDSPYWWASTPNGHGGSSRRSTGIRRDQDPEGIKAAAVRAGWLAADPTPKPPQGKTFDDLLYAYLREVSPAKRAPQRDTFSARQLRPHFTGMEMASIGAEEVRGYIAARRAQGMAPGTINKEIGLMSAACNWAKVELEWPINNPWESRRLKEPRGRARWLTEEEASALLRQADASKERWPWLADFCRICLYAGLRPGEALNLQWTRVDMGRELLRFEPADQKNGRHGTVPINQKVRAALIDRARYRAEHCPASTWVFCQASGERVISTRRAFEGIAKASGLEDLHQHDLRRTFGSWLVQRGVGIERVSELLRHGNVAITARVYAHLRPSDLAAAVSVLDTDGYRVSRQGFTPEQEDTRRDQKQNEAG